MSGLGERGIRGLEPMITLSSTSLNDVLSAFKEATPLEAPNVAGGLWVTSVALGGVLVLAWLFQAGRNAAPGGFLQAPRVWLLVVAAFITLLLTLGVFYQ